MYIMKPFTDHWVFLNPYTKSQLSTPGGLHLLILQMIRQLPACSLLWLLYDTVGGTNLTSCAR